MSRDRSAICDLYASLRERIILCKVSVVVPVYNTERYLRACLESLAAQTLDDVEVIVVDDGSTDGSLAIAREFERRTPGPIFRVFALDHGGVSRARNYGAERSGGGYLAFVDSDDDVEPDYCRAMYEKALRDGNDVVICGRDFIKMERGRLVHNTASMTDFEPDNYRLADHPELLVNISTGPWNKLVKRELFFRVRFPEGVQIREDFMFVVKTFCLAERVGVVRRPLYNYYRSRQGLTAKFDEARLAWLPCMDELRRFFDEQRLMGDLGEALEGFCAIKTFVLYPMAIATVEADWRIRARYVRETWAYLRAHFPHWRENRYYIEYRARELRPHCQRFYSARHALWLIHASRFLPEALNKALRRADLEVTRLCLSLADRLRLRTRGSAPDAKGE